MEMWLPGNPTSELSVLTLVGRVAHEPGQERAHGARKGLGPERHQMPRQVVLLLMIGEQVFG